MERLSRPRPGVCEGLAVRPMEAPGGDPEDAPWDLAKGTSLPAACSPFAALHLRPRSHFRFAVARWDRQESNLHPASYPAPRSSIPAPGSSDGVYPFATVPRCPYTPGRESFLPCRLLGCGSHATARHVLGRVDSSPASVYHGNCTSSVGITSFLHHRTPMKSRER